LPNAGIFGIGRRYEKSSAEATVRPILP